MQRVTEYEVVFDMSATGKGAVRVKLQGQDQWVNLPVDNETEYAVALMLLDKPGVGYDPSTKWLRLPPRAPGS